MLKKILCFLIGCNNTGISRFWANVALKDKDDFYEGKVWLYACKRCGTVKLYPFT